LWEAPVRGGALLGVHEGRVIVAGERLWWINLYTGRVDHYWPDGQHPRGKGRGLIAQGNVYWPTEGGAPAIYVFDATTGEQKDRVDLSKHGAKAGKLTVAGDTTLLTTADEVVAFGPR